MGFEKFTLVGKSFAPRVSIWSRGQIGFNNGAVSRYKLDEFSHIVFFFDRELNKVGLRFTNDGSEEGAVNLNKRSTGISAGMKSFLDYHNVDYTETAQYDLEFDEEEGLYVVDLNKRKPTKKEK